MSEIYAKIICTCGILFLCVCGVGIGTIHNRRLQRICNIAAAVLLVVGVGVIILAIWS